VKVFLETPTEDIMDHLRAFYKYAAGELSREELELFLKEKELEERRVLESEEMDRYYRKYPHG